MCGLTDKDLSPFEIAVYSSGLAERSLATQSKVGECILFTHAAFPRNVNRDVRSVKDIPRCRNNLCDVSRVIANKKHDLSIVGTDLMISSINTPLFYIHHHDLPARL